MTDLGSLYLCHCPSNPSPSAPGEVQYSHSLLCLPTSHCFILFGVPLYFGYLEDKTAEEPVKVLQTDL